jgi:class 3 adenylate cyclase
MNYVYLVSFAGHLFVLALFLLLQVDYVAPFNLITLWAFPASFFLNRQGKHRSALYIAWIEVILHSYISILVIGWDSGFFYFMLLSFPLITFIPFWSQWYKILLAFLTLSLLVTLYVLSEHYVYYPSFNPDHLFVFQTYTLIVFALCLVVIGYFYNKAVVETEVLLQDEFQRSESLLLNILPPRVARRLKEGEKMVAQKYLSASILFLDIVGFTALSKNIEPEDLVEILNEIFSGFDALSEKHGLEKIKTIGDSYMAASGIPVVNPQHAFHTAAMALDMKAFLVDYNERKALDLSVRIGIHSGPVVAGVIGKKKWSYDLWGDTVNTASRMEALSPVGEIQISEETWTSIKGRFHCRYRGRIAVKGKGKLKTYLLLGTL